VLIEIYTQKWFSIKIGDNGETLSIEIQSYKSKGPKRKIIIRFNINYTVKKIDNDEL
jgi:hypothetical protein